MKGKSLQEFEGLYSKFKTREQEIPQNQRWKLLFIAQRIYKTQFKPMQLSEAQQEEIKQLTSLDSNTLAIVFNFLIKTLLVDRKSEVVECKIRYPGMFQLWKNCRLSTSGKNLIVITEKILHKYDLTLLDISNCKKSKYTFDLYFKNQLLFNVKFSSNDAFKEFIAHVQSQIERSKDGENSRSATSKMDRSYQQSVQEPRSLMEMDIKQEIINLPQKVPELQRKPSELIDQKPTGYQIIQENQHLLMCIKSGEPRVYISLLMTTQCQLDRVVNFYIQQKEWNGFINLEQIKQTDENEFEVYRTFKKQSIIETQKSTLAKLRVICSKNSANLIEESIEDDAEGKSEKIQCTIKSITKFYRCLGGTKIIIDTNFRTKGYNNLKYSINMITKLYSDLKFFQNSFKISQLQKNKLKSIITPVTNSIVQLRQSRRMKESTFNSSKEINEADMQRSHKKGQNEGENANTNDTLELNPVRDEKQERRCVFVKLKPCSPIVKPTNEYIEMVGNNEHERYYLPYKFNQSILPKYDSYSPPYILSQMMKKGNQYKISKDNELIYVNYDVLNGQKDSLKFIIKQIGANIITGKSCLNVSMPVDIFQSRSLLQRSACAFGSVPDYLLPVADADPLTQIKNVLTLFATIPTLQLLMQKPFNPILGQTFQAYIKGIPIYYEQISHHPPVSAFYMTCPEFTMHGKLVAFADVSINSAVGGNEGVTHIIFRNGSHFQCYFPPCEISGLIFGNRSFRAYGKGFILEKKSNLFAEMSIQKPKKGLYEQGDEKLTPADLIGGIFRVKPEFMSEVSSQGSLRKHSGLSKKEVEAKLADIRGIWFQEIRISGQVINKNIQVYPLQYPKVALPSDSNYREDILYHKINDLPQSQKMKQFLEVKQRGDRKLRERFAKQAKKKSS